MDDWNSHVHPHGPLTQIAPRLWSVKGSLPRGTLPRNMIVYRTDGGELWLHSPIALDEPGIRALEGLGRPKWIVVPSAFHRLDGGVYKARYPEARLVCPAGARGKVERKFPVDATSEEAFAGTPGIRAHRPDGLKPVELAYELDLGDGKRALVVSDMLMNLPELPGVGGWVLGVIGSTGFFGMTGIARMFMLGDRARFRAWIESVAGWPGLDVFTTSHGDPIRESVPDKLRSAAARLS